MGMIGLGGGSKEGHEGASSSSSSSSSSDEEDTAAATAATGATAGTAGTAVASEPQRHKSKKKLAASRSIGDPTADSERASMQVRRIASRAYGIMSAGMAGISLTLFAAMPVALRGLSAHGSCVGRAVLKLFTLFQPGGLFRNTCVGDVL